MAREILFGTGWRPDPPDERDLHLGHASIRDALKGTGVLRALAAERVPLPGSVDLRKWCSPVQFQGYYNTCTAHVTAGMVELLENKAHGSYVAGSRLFLYQVARRILGEQGDPGVYLRQMMGAVAMFGLPPEKFWPYLDTSVKNDPRLDSEPDAFVYAAARDFGGVHYFRVDDGKDDSTEDVLRRIRVCLAASLPSSLGFSLYRSALETAAKTGEMPLPHPDEKPAGSHAVLLVGYDDARRIGGDGVEEATGAFLFKNSWGADWGDKGYGWLPYAYLEDGLAKDCWTMTGARWLETDAFQIDLEQPGPGD